MIKPKISIIIPCYCVEKYLDKCMYTVVNQLIEDIEIILVDDASPDNVPEICDSWARKDSRVRVIHKKNNEGLGYARNTGLEVATGEYVAFIDSDDYVDTSMYSILYDAARQGTFDVVYCGLRYEYPNGQLSLINDFSDVKIFDNREDVARVGLSFIAKTEICSKNRLFMSVWHGLYKKEIIDKWHLRFHSEREVLSEDLPFQVEFCLKAQCVKFIPDCLYTYCYNKNSLTHNFNKAKFDSAFRLRNLMLSITSQFSENKVLVDSEFYSRIRGLITMLVFSNNYSLVKKYRIISSLCHNNIWKDLDMSSCIGMSWKYLEQYRLLKSNAPLRLMLFCVFDKLVNRQMFSTNHSVN